MSASGIKALSAAPGLARLNLFACPVGDDGAAELAHAISAGAFCELRTLSATGCKIGDAGVAALMGAVIASRPATLEVRVSWWAKWLGLGLGLGLGLEGCHAALLSSAVDKWGCRWYWRVRTRLVGVCA